MQKFWTRYAIILLGIWMVAQPLTFDSKSFAMSFSDSVAGILLLVLGGYALVSSKQWVMWAICLVGVWLQFAPLLFWAPESASYINDVVVGVLVITLAVILPANPLEERVTGGLIPPGWSYNPSAQAQRLPIVFFGFLAWMFARYMTAYQLGYLDTIFDPVFGDGTEKVITSSLSEAFPVPDAGLGAMAYTLEVLMACHGSQRRWHTMPWFVLLFALLVIPLGLISIILIILQPILVHAWCTWCLLTAVCMLIMVALAIDEVVAVLQFLTQSKREGKPMWEIFWKGGEAPGSLDTRSQISSYYQAMIWGISIPWNLIITALLGLWLMFSPHILDVYGASSDSDHIIGALVVALSIISMAEVVRSGRFLILLLGLWVFLSTWILAENSKPAMVSHIVTGLLLMLFSLPRGAIKEKYGSWDRHNF